MKQLKDPMEIFEKQMFDFFEPLQDGLVNQLCLLHETYKLHTEFFSPVPGTSEYFSSKHFYCIKLYEINSKDDPKDKQYTPSASNIGFFLNSPGIFVGLPRSIDFAKNPRFRAHIFKLKPPDSLDQFDDFRTQISKFFSLDPDSATVVSFFASIVEEKQLFSSRNRFGNKSIQSTLEFALHDFILRGLYSQSIEIIKGIIYPNFTKFSIKNILDYFGFERHEDGVFDSKVISTKIDLVQCFIFPGSQREPPKSRFRAFHRMRSMKNFAQKTSVSYLMFQINEPVEIMLNRKALPRFWFEIESEIAQEDSKFIDSEYSRSFLCIKVPDFGEFKVKERTHQFNVDFSGWNIQIGSSSSSKTKYILEITTRYQAAKGNFSDLLHILSGKLIFS